MTRRSLLVAVPALLAGAAGCETFSRPKGPPTVNFPKEQLQGWVRGLDQVFGQLFSHLA